MNITKTAENGTVTIKPEGWLDTDSSPELGKVIESVEEAAAIVLDFENVEYMSSAGLRQVISAGKKAKSLNAGFEVINVGPEVMNIFRMTLIDKKFTVRTK